MKNMILASAAAASLASLAAFDSGKAPADTATTKGNTPAAKPAAATKAEVPKGEPTAIRTDVAMPEKKSRRGTTSKFPFADLQVGQSFGIKGRTAEQMASTISNQNRKYLADKKDEAGNVIYKMTEVKNAEGQVTAKVPSTETEKVKTRDFFAVNTDPKTDPDGADCRVFRKL